jgi:hypothetical protein
VLGESTKAFVFNFGLYESIMKFGDGENTVWKAFDCAQAILTRSYFTAPEVSAQIQRSVAAKCSTNNNNNSAKC